MSPRRRWPTPPGSAVVAALLLTGLNALKPAHMDDAIYLVYAAEFAAHPFAPYGFSFGTPDAVPATAILVPPILPYWLGGGTIMLGSDVFLLRWWLLPFAAALTWALAHLASALAPSLRVPLFWLCVAAPTILPGFNFMLDVPALALGLAALVLVMRSVERQSWALAAVAGALAGLAMQTKYTALISCLVVVAWCVLSGQPARGALVLVVALAVAAGWECAVALVHGESHFLFHLQLRRSSPVTRALRLIQPLSGQLAALAPVVALLGSLALGWTGRVPRAAAMLGGLVALLLVPSTSVLLMGPGVRPLLTTASAVYGSLAVLVLPPLAASFWRLARMRDAGPGERALDRLVLVWVLLEIAGCLVLSPFPAARRMSGLLIALTLLAGRLAHLRAVAPRPVARLAVASAALALLVFVTDTVEARAFRAAAGRVRAAHAAPPDGTFWYLDWWGFGFYASAEGLAPLQLNRRMPREGDLLAVSDASVLRDTLARHAELRLHLVDEVAVGDAFPLRTVPGYYAGGAPLASPGGDRVRVFVYRVTGVNDFQSGKKK